MNGGRFLDFLNDISPRLGDITLDDFPDGHSFGNGITLNATVPLKDISQARISWVIFDDADAPFIRSHFAALCEVVEGPIS